MTFRRGVFYTANEVKGGIVELLVRTDASSVSVSPSEVQEAVVTTYCRDVQGHNDGLSANWDFSGDPCPIEKFEWGHSQV